MKFNYQKFQCARCKKYRNTLISITFYINQTKTKICFDCFFPLLLKSDEETIEEIFNFMDEEKN